MKKHLLVVKTKVKTKVKTLAVGAALTVSSSLASIGLGFCDINGNSSMQNFLKVLFSVLMFGGIISAAFGAVSLIKLGVGMAGGEPAPQGALGKDIGLFIGGIAVLSLKAIITGITGQDPTTMTFM